jgi:hypothetical protein
MISEHENKPDLIAIGYWSYKWDFKSILPYPSDFIDETWDVNELQVVAAYIAKQPAVEHWRGYSACRLCGEVLGSTCLSDGKFIFPEKFEHYLLAHKVRPPQAFIDHVLRANEKEK